MLWYSLRFTYRGPGRVRTGQRDIVVPDGPHPWQALWADGHLGNLGHT